jgi:hypothetical protein
MGSHRFWRILSAGVFAAVIAGCGGGGGGGFTEGGDTDPNPDPSGPTVASLLLLSDSPQLKSNAQIAANGVTLTAIARDASQNVVSGAAVAFSTTDSALIAAANPALTDDDGQVQATVTTGGDPTNRSVTVRASSGTASATVTIAVVGTQLTISGPSSAQINSPVQFSASLVNSGGEGIAGQVLSLSTNSGNTLSASSLTTDSSGAITFTLTPTVANSFVSVTGLNLAASQNVTVSTDQFTFTGPAAGAFLSINQPQTVSVRWLTGSTGTPVPNGTVVNFSATRGTLSAPSATTTNGVASVTISSAQAGASLITASSSALTAPTTSRSVQFVASTATTLELQADPSVVATNQTATISAIVRDPTGNLVANKQVEFLLTDRTSGNLSSSTAITDSLGTARITYTSSSVTSSDNGVRIDATARNSNGSTAVDFVTLTVGSAALRILLGTGNEIFEPNETTYQLPYSAIVTDAAGNPTPDANFQLRALPLQYFKGFYVKNEEDEFVPFTTAACANEDVNANGILDEDLGEDVNGNGILDPGNVASVPTTLPLDADDGSVQFNVTYTQDRGNWVQMRLTARAAVAGTETTERADFILPILEDDADNPPATIYDEQGSGVDADGNGELSGRFGGSPYGIADDCANPN